MRRRCIRNRTRKTWMVGKTRGKDSSIYGESGRLQVSEKEIPGMRRMNGWVLCMSCYRKAVPIKAKRGHIP